MTFKRYFDTNKNRDLVLSEILNSDLPNFKDGYKFSNRGIKFLDSTPDEIVGLAKDMIDDQLRINRSDNIVVDKPTKFQTLVTSYRGIDFWAQLSHVWENNNSNFLD